MAREACLEVMLEELGSNSNGTKNALSVSECRMSFRRGNVWG